MPHCPPFAWTKPRRTKYKRSATREQLAAAFEKGGHDSLPPFAWTKPYCKYKRTETRGDLGELRIGPKLKEIGRNETQGASHTITSLSSTQTLVSISEKNRVDSPNNAHSLDSKTLDPEAESCALVCV